MNLSELCCSIEHGKRFAELGLFEDSCFVWFRDINGYRVESRKTVVKILEGLLQSGKATSAFDIYPAPTSDEILRVLETFSSYIPESINYVNDYAEILLLYVDSGIVKFDIENLKEEGTCLTLMK